MKKHMLSESDATIAPNATTVANTETPTQGRMEMTTLLPDPERGHRMVIEIGNLELLKMLSSDERKQVLESMWSWMVQPKSDYTPVLSEQATLLLCRLMDAQRRSARLYHQRVAMQVLRDQRRLARARRTK